LEELQDTISSGDDPEHSLYEQELRSALEAAVGALPPLYRTVYVLREIEEMNVAETAGCLGSTVENVKTRLHRARALLRHRLERAIGARATHTFSYLGARCDRMTAAVMLRIAGLAAG
jgi:RNA polymerase sigma-70 factor (ECF subfamily)